MESPTNILHVEVLEWGPEQPACTWTKAHDVLMQTKLKVGGLWRLPRTRELQAMLEKGSLGFDRNEPYWTINENKAVIVSFHRNSQRTVEEIRLKPSATANCRFIRTIHRSNPQRKDQERLEIDIS